MTNKLVFPNSVAGPATSVINEAGGRAYSVTPKSALVKLAATGTFHGVGYANAQTQWSQFRELTQQVDDNQFLAKLALFSRHRSYMKDMPAALVVELSNRDPELLHKIFDRVVDNGRVLRTVFRMIRSGQFGRRGLSSSLQRAFQRWLNNMPVNTLLAASIGCNPSLRDILRMARPKPKSNLRRALFGWLAGRDVENWRPASRQDLPDEVLSLIRYRQATTQVEQAAIADTLNVRWDLLADAALGPATWSAIARKMGPQALRMNLNTLLRHGVFLKSEQGMISKIAQAIGMTDPACDMADFVARKLADVDGIIRSRQFPYQYLAAHLNAHQDMPQEIVVALHQAAEVACGQIPTLPAPIVVGLDVSGSMNFPLTGSRGRGAKSKMRCVDVAALFASAILRGNPQSVLIPFDTRAIDIELNPCDSILRLAKRLSTLGGGGTDCSIPLLTVNTKHADREFGGVIVISDNQSWQGIGQNGSTAMMSQWHRFVARQKKLNRIAEPKLVCIDVQPYRTTQAPDRGDILNIGGFSDAVFPVVASFLSGDGKRMVDEVESIRL